jgi:hypothetical protein
MVTIIAPIKGENIAEARRRIEALGNPAVPAVAGEIEAVADAHPGAAIHFASLNVFDASAGGGHLVLEFSADGDAGAVLTALAGRLDHWLTPVFALASDRGSGPLDRYWRSHVVTVGQGFFDNIGVVFAGTPGLSVARIRRESSLVARVTELLSDQVPSTTSALVQLDAVREHLRADPYLSWALEAEAAEALNPEPSLIQALPGLALLAFKTYLWPLILPALIAFGVVLAMQGLTPPGFMRALSAALWAACLTVLAVVLALGVAYLVLRRREAGEVPEDRPPDPDLVGAILDRENHASQNHLAALSVMKTGALRRFLLRVVLWLVGQVAGRLSRPGFLGTLSTIHFARWVMVPRTGDLLFLSNYDGSWESYLEDRRRRHRRRPLQALGTPPTDSHRAVVLGLPRSDHREHSDQRRHPPGDRDHPHGRGGRALALVLRLQCPAGFRTRGQPHPEPGLRWLGFSSSWRVPRIQTVGPHPGSAPVAR